MDTDIRRDVAEPSWCTRLVVDIGESFRALVVTRPDRTAACGPGVCVSPTFGAMETTRTKTNDAFAALDAKIQQALSLIHI